MSHYLDIHNANQRKIAAKDVSGVEIFKVGRHKPMTGDVLNFLDSDLEQIAENYDAESQPAPVVVGHPKTDAPAYGWVSGLRVDGDKLVADFSDIDPSFAQLVKDKRYRKISASFWTPTAPNNPTPGHYALKHVGFLGAAAPAASGLKEAEFKATDQGVIAFGEDDIADLPESYQRNIARHQHEIAIEKLIASGRVLPMNKGQLLDFVSSVDDGSAVSFSDGESKGKAEWILSYLAGQPEVVSFGEMGIDREAPAAPANIPHGFAVDPDRHALHSNANALAQSEGIPYLDAVRRLEG